MFKASDLIIDRILDCDTYSMTDFTPYEQIRQLENGAVCPEDFLRLAELETFDADNWLYLFQVLPGRTPQENWRQKILSPAGWNRLRNSDAISPIRQNCWRQIPDDGQN